MPIVLCYTPWNLKIQEIFKLGINNDILQNILHVAYAEYLYMYMYAQHKTYNNEKENNIEEL